jgi:hypothetical protein
VGDDRCELAELLVPRLGAARVGGEDQVGLRLRDLLDRSAVGVVVPDGCLGVEFRRTLVEPVRGALLVAAPRQLGCADRDDAEAEPYLGHPN